MDYLDTIRKQNQTVKWYQAVVEQIVPSLRRDSNYADLERVRAQSEWDDLNQEWRVPKFAVERKFCLPPATAIATRPSSPSMTSPPTSGGDDEGQYQLRSEARLIERLNESALRDPAADYFRSRMRNAESSRTPLESGLTVQKSTTPIQMSPLLGRPRHL